MSRAALSCAAIDPPLSGARLRLAAVAFGEHVGGVMLAMALCSLFIQP